MLLRLNTLPPMKGHPISRFLESQHVPTWYDTRQLKFERWDVTLEFWTMFTGHYFLPQGGKIFWTLTLIPFDHDEHWRSICLRWLIFLFVTTVILCHGRELCPQFSNSSINPHKLPISVCKSWTISMSIWPGFRFLLVPGNFWWAQR